MLHIFIDADACPVKAETYKVAGRYNLKVTVVANSWMRVPRESWITMEVVGGGFDEAEIYFWARSEVLCSDPNYDSEINILDAVLLINILYKLDMNPGPLEINDVDNSGAVNILDVVYIINYKYKDGPAPDPLESADVDGTYPAGQKFQDDHYRRYYADRS